MAVYLNARIPTQSTRHIEKQENMPQSKKHNQSPETYLKEVYELPDKKFKIIVIKILSEFKKMIQNKMRLSTKQIENVKKKNDKAKILKLKKTKSEFLNSPKRFKYRVVQAKESAKSKTGNLKLSSEKSNKKKKELNRMKKA